MARRWLGIGCVMLFMLVVGFSQVRPQAQLNRQQEVDPAEEAFIHTPAGFAKEGRPAVAQGDQVGTLRVVVADQETGRPAFCRVNVVGADGNYYEPKENPLAPWSLHQTANRKGKAPIRYYGWFFYSPGEFTVTVPAGLVCVEVWKGYEFRPVTLSTRVAAGATRDLKVALQRTVPMTDLGYYSGDTHIHLNRTTQADDERALDLLAAEDIRFGFILCMNDPRTYSGVMSRQIWPQTNGFGPTSVQRRGAYTIASGQEYRCNTYGHICLLMPRRLVLEDTTVDPNNWPVFGLVGQETRQLGGYSFHAHGGYAREIYADFAQRATDGVELLQFAEYRGIALQGWYRMLNIGYRFPAVGACDFPYCRALGDSRTYVTSTGPPTAADWVRHAAQGRSFFTTGPLVLLDVDGQAPGDTLRKEGKGPHRVTARVRVRCEVAPVTHVDLVVNGRTVQQLVVPRAVGQGQWLELEEAVELTESSWLAARAYSTATTGKPDAEAHTNPVYVTVDGQAPYNQADLDWLVARLDEQIAATEKRNFAEKPKALEFFRRSREELQHLRRAGGQRAPAPGG
jgi:hypothetical protein